MPIPARADQSMLAAAPPPQPAELRVVRLTGDDVPPDAFLGIAHRVEPVLQFYNSGVEAIWTIPGALVGAAFGAPASSARAPLPVARMISASGAKANEVLYVSAYQVLDGGGFKLRVTFSPRPRSSTSARATASRR